MMGYTQYIGGTAAELGTKTSFEIDRVTRPAQHTVVPIQEQSNASEASASYTAAPGEVIDSVKAVGNDAADCTIKFWLYGEDVSTGGHEYEVEDADSLFGPFIKVEVTSDDGGSPAVGHKGLCYVKKGGL